MLYLTVPSSGLVRECMRAGLIGAMCNPGDWKPARELVGITVAIDNGCFADNWREERWLALLDKYQELDPLFVVAPDVVGDAAATVERSRPWLPVLRDRGFRVAYAAQDGWNPDVVPWDAFDVLFVGGTDDWKLSHDAFSAAIEARARGKGCHLGRVNSLRRLRYAVPFFDTADGTFIKFGPDINIERVRHWLRELERVPQMIYGGPNA